MRPRSSAWRGPASRLLLVVVSTLLLVPAVRAGAGLLLDAGQAWARSADGAPRGALTRSTGVPPIAFASVLNDTSPPLPQLCNLPTLTPTTTATRTPTPTATPTLPGGTPTPPMPTPLVSFAGLNALNSHRTPTEGLPSDTSGAIGPSNYVMAVNFAFQVFDRGGSPLIPPAFSSCFWNGFGGQCEGLTGSFWSDMVVLYDRIADRWLVSRFAGITPGNQCFAISTSGDPLGTYYRYAYQISADFFNDYPKFGIWPDAYYMSARANKIFSREGALAVAFQRSQMLQGQPALAVGFFVGASGVSVPTAVPTLTPGVVVTPVFTPTPTPTFPVNAPQFTILPSDWDGQTAPPPGAPNYFLMTQDDNLGFADDALQVFEFRVNWGNLLASTFRPVDWLPVLAFNANLCNEYGTGLVQCVQQPGTTALLDTIAYGSLMYRLTYRNFGAYESLVVNQTVAMNAALNQAGIRWYELRKSGGATSPCGMQGFPGAWCVYQSGDWAPDANSRWIGSAAMDGMGNLAIGFNVSSSTVYPSIHYAGRLATDPLGVLAQGERVLIGGESAQGGPGVPHNWADWSQLTLDPLDDCTFWYGGAYQPPPPVPPTTYLETWHTRVGAFRFANCQGPVSTNTPTATATATRTATIHPATATALALTGTPTVHPLTATATAATATAAALTATSTATLHPLTATALALTATPTVHPLTATATAATATAAALTATSTATLHPATATAQALTGTPTVRPLTATATLHPATATARTATALALTATATRTPAVVPAGSNPPPSSGLAGTPCTVPVGGTCLVTGQVAGSVTRTGSATFALTASGPAGAAVGGLPAVFLPTTAGVENARCGPIGVSLQAPCSGTTAGVPLQGATITVRVPLVGGGTQDVTGVVLGAGLPPGALGPASPGGLGPVAPLPPLSPPLPLLPPAPPALPPPLAAVTPEPLGPAMPAPGPAPDAAAGVPVIPEGASGALLLAGLVALGGWQAWRTRRRQE